jgi:Bacterial PH domain
MSVDIRPPMFVRAYAYVFIVVWIAACLFGFFKALPHLSAVIPLLMLVGGSVFCWRFASVGARSEGQTLLVRNVYRTRRIPAAAITEVRTGRSPMQPFGHTVFVVTDSEAVALDVGLIGRLRGGAERDRAALEAWVSGFHGTAAPT